MFANINVIDDRDLYVVPINVMHVVDVKFDNPKNPDAGTIINLRDGRHWVSPDPLDVVMKTLNKTTERYAGIIMVSYLAEVMRQSFTEGSEDAEKPTKPVRKKRTTTVKKKPTRK